MYITLYIILGLLCGSFATMASFRLPKEEEIVVKRSHCPKCGHFLSVLDLIPVFSWLMQSGKCRYCKAKISIRYPLIEVFTASFFAINYIIFGLSLMSIIMCLITLILIIMIVTDLEHKIIPFGLQLSLIPFMLIYRFVERGDMLDNFIQMALGAVVMFLIGLGLQVGYRVIKKKEGLGGADVIFFGIAGGFLGLKAMALFFFISGILGIVTHLIWSKIKKEKYFPFGPAITFSFYICLILKQNEVFSALLG